MKSDYRINISESIEDDEWDNFVEEHTDGHFEQSSLWGQVKTEGGWQPLRIIAYSDDEVIGGAQILLRNLPLLGKAGYIPRGPLIEKGHHELLPLIIREIKKLAKKLTVILVIVQAPQDGREIDEALAEEGFVPDDSLDIITATARIDLTQGYETILCGMNRNSRRNIRSAERNGVVVREGSEANIPAFFQMMVETCRRQGVNPNPPSVSHMLKLWDSFAQRGPVRLFLTFYQGEAVSGLVGIPFGKVFYAWKMGWTGRFERSGSNHLLHWEAIKWAKANGHSLFDFMAVDRSVAEAALQGNAFNGVQRGSDLFKLSLGGHVVLLPEPRIYISNVILESFYSHIFRRLYRPGRSISRNSVIKQLRLISAFSRKRGEKGRHSERDKSFVQ